MYVLQYIQGILSTRKNIPLANTSENFPNCLAMAHIYPLNQTKTLEIMSQIKENTRNTTKIWRHAKDSIRCTGKYDQNLKKQHQNQQQLGRMESHVYPIHLFDRMPWDEPFSLPTIYHKNRQSMYINQGCKFGPESKPNSGNQYLDPAWYHLWRDSFRTCFLGTHLQPLR